jgi:hypothetical protein
MGAFVCKAFQTRLLLPLSPRSSVVASTFQKIFDKTGFSNRLELALLSNCRCGGLQEEETGKEDRPYIFSPGAGCQK